MLNKIYSVIGNFFLKRTDEYWQERDYGECDDVPFSTSRFGRNVNGTTTKLKNQSHHQLTPDTDPSFNIRIYSAKGGRVVECHTTTNHANQQFQGSSTDLYVIPDGTDLVDELGKILMMHSLTK